MFNPHTALKPAGVGKKAGLRGIPRLFILRNTTYTSKYYEVSANNSTQNQY